MGPLITFIATGFGSGYLRPGPGTWGSLVGLIIFYFLPLSLITIILGAVIGIYICQKAEEYLGEHDSPKIVWDEIVGIWIALWSIPLALYPLAFIIFRILDIKKFYPIDRLQGYPGGLGIMLDDIAAGLITRVLLGIIIYFM